MATGLETVWICHAHGHWDIKCAVSLLYHLVSEGEQSSWNGNLGDCLHVLLQFAVIYNLTAHQTTFKILRRDIFELSVLFLQRFTSAGRPTLCMGGTMPQAGIPSWIKRGERASKSSPLCLVTVDTITTHSRAAFFLHHRKPHTFNLETKGSFSSCYCQGSWNIYKAKGANTGFNLCDCFWNGTLLLMHSVIRMMAVNKDISTGSFLS